MAKSESAFPFALTFCRPWHVAAARDSGPRQLFGIVGDGSRQCSIADWPQPGLPFPLHPRSALTVQIFVAEDRAAFERGEAEELGSCCLPLWRVPEVLPRASPEPPKLWLALEAPQGHGRSSVPLVPGGAVAGADAREEAELLERFERSREQAANNLQTPRICVLVQALQGAPAPMAGAQPPRRQLAAGTRTAEQPPSPSPRPESGEELWRVRFEEERQRYEERRRQCQRDLRLARDAVEPLGEKLEALSRFAAHRLERCWLDAALGSWCAWVASEKCRRQFEQVNDELDGLGRDRRALAAQQARSKAEAERRWRAQDAQLRRQGGRWAALLGAAGALLAADGATQAAWGCLAVWRSWAARSAAACGLVERRQDDLAWHRLAMVLLVWRAAVGQRGLEDLRLAVEEVRAGVPLRARRLAAGLVASATAWAGPEGEGLFEDVFSAWARAARRRALLHAQAVAVLSAAPWRSLGALLLECCLVLWRGCVSNVEAAAAAERAAGRELQRLCRRRAGGLLDASREACQVGGTAAALMCWHFFAAQCALQRSLERAFSQHQDVKTSCARWREGLDSLRAEHARERARWQADHDSLFEELCQVQRLHEEEHRASEECLEGRRSVELQEAAAAQRSRVLGDELADMRLQTQRASEQLRLAEADAEVAEALAGRRHETCEEECAAALLGVQPLQQEAARQLERRQSDVRAARQQARAQVARQESSARRMATAQEEEQDAWEQRLQQTEARVARLEQEVQQTQQAQQSRRASRAEEPERADLLAEVMAAEQRLEAFEEGERGRRQELTALRGTHSELQVQHAALERRRASALRT